MTTLPGFWCVAHLTGHPIPGCLHDCQNVLDLYVPFRHRLPEGAAVVETGKSVDYPRVTVNLPVELSYDGRTFQERATTLGGGGMFLAVTTPLPTGTEMRIRFRPAKHLPAIQAKAKVVYQIAGRGTGIEFTEIDPQDRQVLLRIIHRRTADRGREARVPLATQIYSDEGMSLAFSRDVSVGGMFVETSSLCQWAPTSPCASTSTTKVPSWWRPQRSGTCWRSPGWAFSSLS